MLSLNGFLGENPGMTFDFTKMNGAGNDFVMVDNRNGSLSLSRDQIARLCDRHRGIGADGLMLLVPCASGKAEWAWQFWNSDGSDAEMCGNGARCFGRYIQKLTGLDYQAANRLLFEVIEYIEPRMKADQAYPPVVGVAVMRVRHRLGNEEAEKRLLAEM